MEKEINIVEILKDCPSGMELNCTMFENVTFECIKQDEYYPIIVKIKEQSMYLSLTKTGCWNTYNSAKCVIFPKGKTTWEGFHRPFVDGDVVVAEDAESFQLFLLKHLTHSEDNNYDGYCYFGWDFQCNKLFEKGNWGFNRLATEEEKAKLFQAIKDNGYKWNEETKTLEKLPSFKVGNKIKQKGSQRIYVISSIEFDRYILNNNQFIRFGDEHIYELVPNKFDITTLVPFESRVLVRIGENSLWKPAIFGFYDKIDFYTVGSIAWDQCIPYEGNEHLLGTTDDCDEFYKNW